MKLGFVALLIFLTSATAPAGFIDGGIVLKVTNNVSAINLSS